MTSAIETAVINGVEYVGVHVMPRNFANEWDVYLAKASDAPVVAALAAKVARSDQRPVGSDYRARWMTTEELLGHARSRRLNNGLTLTVTPDGDTDTLTL